MTSPALARRRAVRAFSWRVVLRAAALACAAWIGAGVVAPAALHAQGSGRLAQAPAAGPDSSARLGEATAATVAVHPLFVVRDGAARGFAEEPPHPGEVLGLRLDYAPGDRRGVELVAPGVPVDRVVPLRLVLGDARADSADVLEVLLVGVGELEIPEILLRSVDRTTIATQPLELEVVSSLAEGEAEPAPPRDQSAMGLEPWGVALLGLLLAAVIAAAWFVARRRRRRSAAPVTPAVPDVAPDIWARDQLDQLLASDLLGSGQIKIFHVRLAEISKEYLSRRFDVPLREHTTEECPALLHRAGVERSVCHEVGEWLARIDLVKFAGERPGPFEVKGSVEALRNMIEATRVKTTPQSLAEPAVARPVVAAEGTR